MELYSNNADIIIIETSFSMHFVRRLENKGKAKETFRVRT